MMVIKRGEYASPETKVIQLETERVFCVDSTLRVIWTLNANDAASSATEWGRVDYGTADEL